jgi:hypothetical protein
MVPFDSPLFAAHAGIIFYWFGFRIVWWSIDRFSSGSSFTLHFSNLVVYCGSIWLWITNIAGRLQTSSIFALQEILSETLYPVLQIWDSCMQVRWRFESNWRRNCKTKAWTRSQFYPRADIIVRHCVGTRQFIRSMINVWSEQQQSKQSHARSSRNQRKTLSEKSTQ